jgi:hypothetical protein
MRTALFWEIALCNFKIHAVSTFRMEEPVPFKALIKVKVKLSRYRPRVAQRVPGS